MHIWAYNNTVLKKAQNATQKRDLSAYMLIH